MSESIQHRLTRIRPPRVKITYDVEIGDAIIKKELPFVMGIMADLSGDKNIERAAPIPLYKERVFVYIDRDNFDQVLADAQPRVKAPLILAEADSTEDGPGATAEIGFSRLDDFTPDALVGRVPELKAALDRRNYLMDLAAKIDGNDFLYGETEKIVTDQSYLKSVKAQLDGAAPPPKETDQTGEAAEAEGGTETTSAEQAPADEPLASILKAMVKTPSQDASVRKMLTGALAEIEAMNIKGPVGNVGELLTLKAGEIDRQISLAVNHILHCPAFQELEAIWRGLAYLVFGAETGEMLKLRLLNASFKELANDLEKAIEFDQSRLFKNVYEEEYGTFGGEPYSCLLHIHEYGRTPADISVLNKMTEVAAAAHTPLLTGAAPQVFDLNSFTELSNPRDLAKIFQTTECITWRSLREVEDSRYLNFFMPRMLMRLPYESGAVESFIFEEDVDGTDHAKYLWGNAALAMARCVTTAFAQHNWTAAIRGFEGGGLVEELPVHIYTRSSGDKVAKIPTETAITDRREKELSDLGFIALVYRRGTDKAAFFGGQSLHKPPLYINDEANANARISARLPYLLNASRFAHYVKSIIRDKVGSFTSAQEMADYLNNWISGYVLLTDDASQSTKAKFPLREARVDVYDVPGSPGAYRAIVYLRPHFQLEELTASIRLVATLPPPVPPAE